jgi:hypothetical protein
MVDTERVPASPVPPHLQSDAPAAQPRRRIVPALVAIGQFVRGTVTLPVWIFRRRRRSIDEITVYSAHPSFFLWLLISTGFTCAWVTRHYPNLSVAMGWLFIWVLMYFLVSLLYDLSTRALMLWVGIFMLVWLGSKYVEHLRNVALLGYLFEYLSQLQPELDPGFATVLSWLLLLPWIGSVFHMVLNGRKRFTPNEIGEFHFGEGSELTDRTGLRFRTQYRDVLETILTFGGGDLLAVDNHHNVIKRWDNILGLFFAWNDLDRVLHQRAALIETGEDPEEEAGSK